MRANLKEVLVEEAHSPYTMGGHDLIPTLLDDVHLVTG